MSLFSSRRPKHIAAGAGTFWIRYLRLVLGSAAKNVIKGVGAGAACLLAAPVIGAQTEGLSGLGKGLAVGAAAMLTLPIVGLATGARQLREVGTSSQWLKKCRVPGTHLKHFAMQGTTQVTNIETVGK